MKSIIDAYGKDIPLWGGDLSAENRLGIARQCLRHCWQMFDLGGESMGRSPRCHFLELAMALLGPAPGEDDRLYNDDQWREFIEEYVQRMVQDFATLQRVEDERKTFVDRYDLTPDEVARFEQQGYLTRQEPIE